MRNLFGRRTFSARFAVLTLLIATVATSGVAQRSNTLIKQRCHFYGESPAGSQAFHKDEICTIPGLKLLDQNYRQQDFVCCGGGATAPTTNEAIPSGLELRVKGGHFWSVSNPKLTGNTFSVHTYCGPAALGGPGCNVSVDVIAHYWVTPGEYKSDPFAKVDEVDRVDPPLPSNVPNAQAALASDKILAFVFGVVFVGVLLAVGLLHRNPTPLGIFIFRVVLALAAAGVGAVIPGLVSVENCGNEACVP